MFTITLEWVARRNRTYRIVDETGIEVKRLSALLLIEKQAIASHFLSPSLMPVLNMMDSVLPEHIKLIRNAKKQTYLQTSLLTNKRIVHDYVHAQATHSNWPHGAEYAAIIDLVLRKLSKQQ